jgi:hypothetical protein
MANAVKNHPLNQIAQAGATPMKAAPFRVGSFDDKMAGVLLAQEVLALVKTQATQWPELAGKLFDMTIEGRKHFDDTLKASLTAMKDGIAERHDADRKSVVAPLVRSATVRVSQMRKIAEAITAGMDRETVARAWLSEKKSTSRDAYERDVKETVANFAKYIGMDAIYETAKKFVGSDARGRKADTLLVKISKFIKANEPKDDTAPADVATWRALVEWYNSKV